MSDKRFVPDPTGDETDFEPDIIEHGPPTTADCEQSVTNPGNKAFDNILHVVGHKGRFQIVLLLLRFFCGSNVNLQNYTTVFTTTIPAHRCKVPGLETDTYVIKDDNHAEIVDRYIPKVKDGEYRKCHLLSGLNETGSSIPSSGQRNGENMTSCKEWVYDKTVMKRNLVSELDLVCDRTAIRSHGNMVLFIGKMAVASIQGFLSDLIGRRPCLVLSCFGMFATAIGSIFIFNPISFLVARFMAGFFTTGTYLSIYVLGIEFLTIKQRGLLGNALYITGGVIDAYMALAAYLLRDWQDLLLAVSWPTLCAFIFCWFMPESPRWLISKDRPERAQKEIQDRHLHVFVWSILQYLQHGGNIFLNYAISGFMDAALCLTAAFLVNRFSRKYFYFCLSTIGASTCLLTFLPIVLDAPQWCIVALSLIGKAAITTAYPLLYTYSAELFPTTHRGIGVGSCSMISRLGGMGSSYITDLGVLVGGKMASVLPQLVFGTCATTASLLVLTLPETREGELPATLNDIRGKPKKDIRAASTEMI